MTASGLGLNMSTLRTALPILTGALYALGLGGGLYNFQDPAGGAKMFGIILPSSPTPAETAYIKVHGIRNFTNGTAWLSILAYLQFSKLTITSPLAATAVRRAIGISMLVGSIIGFTDGYILSEFKEAKELSADAVKLAKGQSQGHIFLAVPIALLGLGWLYA